MHVHNVSFYFPPLNHNAQMDTIIIILFGQRERVHNIIIQYNKGAIRKYIYKYTHM